MSLSSQKSPSDGHAAASSSKANIKTISAQHSAGRLTLVATPIGNLADISKRAIEALMSADFILCEDTRVTAKLLRAHGVSCKTQSFNDFNESHRTPAILQKLREGAQIALVSDAGTPLLSDPGFRLTREVIAEKIDLVAIPGPHAASVALTLSGFPPLPYCVYGFLPPKDAARRAALQHVHELESQGLDATLIWYEAPHRLCDTLSAMRDIFGEDRQAAVSRELTKKFEETRRGTLTELITSFEESAPRGEITIVVGPAGKPLIAEGDVTDALQKALLTLSVKDAAAQIARLFGLPKRDIYRRALALSEGVPSQSED